MVVQGVRNRSENKPRPARSAYPSTRAWRSVADKQRSRGNLQPTRQRGPGARPKLGQTLQGTAAAASGAFRRRPGQGGGMKRKRRPRGLWPQSSSSPSVLSAQLCGGPFLAAVGGLGHTPPSIQSKATKKGKHGRVIAFVTISSFSSSSSSWSLSAGRQSGPSAPLSCSLARALAMAT